MGRRSGREPTRTCVGCRVAGPKAGLVRVVREPSGTIRLDRTGTGGGRGAYVHPDPECIAAATRRGGLALAFRAGIQPPQAARLMQELSEIVRGTD
ncbi:MAG TPA: YlxR family protein [Actinomycetota bacterium]|nr:YlxR family protein [Actinomycetota bacterium]